MTYKKTLNTSRAAKNVPRRSKKIIYSERCLKESSVVSETACAWERCSIPPLREWVPLIFVCLRCVRLDIFHMHALQTNILEERQSQLGGESHRHHRATH